MMKNIGSQAQGNQNHERQSALVAGKKPNWKSQSSCMRIQILGLHLCLFLVCSLPCKADQTLFSGINPNTGLVMATDLWNGTKLHDINPNFAENFLGSSFQLEDGGTNLGISMIVSFFDGVAAHPEKNSLVQWLLVEVDGSTAEKNIIIPLGHIHLGSTPWPWLSSDQCPDCRPDSPVKKRLLYRMDHTPDNAVNGGNGVALSIIRFDFSVPLASKLDHIPEEVYINIGIRGSIWTLQAVHSKKGQNPTAAELKSALQKINAAKASEKSLGAASEVKSSANTTVLSALPGVTLSISKTNGYLMITFSPAVTNANLEEAKLNSYPWVWQPATTITNVLTNGWNVVPTTESRVFRVQLK